MLKRYHRFSELTQELHKDEGNGFDTTVLRESVRDSLSLHGRGIELIQCSTDELFYNKVGNEVTLLKKIIRG